MLKTGAQCCRWLDPCSRISFSTWWRFLIVCGYGRRIVYILGGLRDHRVRAERVSRQYSLWIRLAHTYASFLQVLSLPSQKQNLPLTPKTFNVRLLWY